MAIIKPQQDSGFAQIPNSTLQDFSISHGARSILVYLLSLPDNWKIQRTHAAKEAKVSKTTLQKYLSELRNAGYIEYRQIRNDQGKVQGGDYYVYFTPQKQLQASDSKVKTRNQKSRTLEKPNFGKDDHLKRNKETNKQSSKSVTTPARENLNDQSKQQNRQAVDQGLSTPRLPAPNQPDKSLEELVMTELLADHLPTNKHRYARLKIKEYQARFPASNSVADCWAYVVQAVKHQYSLTG